MKLRRSKFDAIYYLSTRTNEFLWRTLPNSFRPMLEETFLYSLITDFDMGSLKVTFFFNNFCMRMVEVTIPTMLPESSFTGN